MTRKTILDIIKNARLNSILTRSGGDEIDNMQKVITFLEEQRAHYMKALIRIAIENPVDEKWRNHYEVQAQLNGRLTEESADWMAQEFAKEIARRGCAAYGFRCIPETYPFGGATLLTLQFQVIPDKQPSTQTQTTQKS